MLFSGGNKSNLTCGGSTTSTGAKQVPAHLSSWSLYLLKFLKPVDFLWKWYIHSCWTWQTCWTDAQRQSRMPAPRPQASTRPSWRSATKRPRLPHNTNMYFKILVQKGCKKKWESVVFHQTFLSPPSPPLFSLFFVICKPSLAKILCPFLPFLRPKKGIRCFDPQSQIWL